MSRGLRYEKRFGGEFPVECTGGKIHDRICPLLPNEFIFLQPSHLFSVPNHSNHNKKSAITFKERKKNKKIKIKTRKSHLTFFLASIEVLFKLILSCGRGKSEAMMIGKEALLLKKTRDAFVRR
jgi:hypothetical protein